MVTWLREEDLLEACPAQLVQVVVAVLGRSAGDQLGCAMTSQNSAHPLGGLAAADHEVLAVLAEGSGTSAVRDPRQPGGAAAGRPHGRRDVEALDAELGAVERGVDDLSPRALFTFQSADIMPNAEMMAPT